MQQGFSILQTNFPGLNEIIKVAKAHPMAYSAMKKRWGHVVETSIRQAKLKPMRGPVQIHLTWVEKTRRRDPDNIRAGSKFILDALVKAKVLPGDSLATVWGLSDSFVVDKEHWRVDVLVTDETAATLLQREHAAVVRKVKAMKDNCNNPCHCCCADLLAWLHERGW